MNTHPSCPTSDPLTFTDAAILDTAIHPDFRAWLDRMRHIGGCQQPIHLTGETLIIEPGTGRLIGSFASEGQPHGRLSIACGNRRATRCEPCSRLHQGDTYQLVVAGLSGGKNIPASVRVHPRVFVTFTAPSFGPLHRVTTANERCRPRRSTPVCEHGNPLGCGQHHTDDDPQVATPICPDCYRYDEHVLWNAHTRDLWQRLHRNLYETVATSRGISRAAARRAVRIAYAKVAEYQRRGAIHFHSVMRFDGPEGPGDQPPPWATLPFLEETIRTAAQRVWVRVPHDGRELTLRLGKQLDIKAIHDSSDHDELTERAVASYIAKYVSKGDIPGVTIDRPIKTRLTIEVLSVPEHIRQILRTCWRLGSSREHRGLNLHRWAHQLGYRGHVTTKSRCYSTTYTALRKQRADHRRAQAGDITPADAITEKHWTYHSSGHSEGQAMFADSIADDLNTGRVAAYEARLEEEQDHD